MDASIVARSAPSLTKAWCVGPAVGSHGSPLALAHSALLHWRVCLRIKVHHLDKQTPMSSHKKSRCSMNRLVPHHCRGAPSSFRRLIQGCWRYLCTSLSTGSYASLMTYSRTCAGLGITSASLFLPETSVLKGSLPPQYSFASSLRGTPSAGSTTTPYELTPQCHRPGTEKDRAS